MVERKRSLLIQLETIRVSGLYLRELHVTYVQGRQRHTDRINMAVPRRSRNVLTHSPLPIEILMRRRYSRSDIRFLRTLHNRARDFR